MPPSNYLGINKESWNKRTEVHVDSTFYDNPSFIKGRSSLNEIELKLLGDISGKSILHLQCHFGQDTISMSRMGAITTGVDLSDESIETAQKLAKKTNTDAQFLCCDVYDLSNHLETQFDIVFTSYGTIGWLPNTDKWAMVIAHFLKPGGTFVFVEFHPVVWMFNDEFSEVAYRYFNSGPIEEIETGTYTDREAPIEQEYITWNHGIGEVISSLLKQNLRIDSFEEFDYSPYDCFKNSIEAAKGKFRIKHLDDKIPMVYALRAKKN